MPFIPLNHTNNMALVARAAAGLICALGVLWLGSRNASAGSYLAECLDHQRDPTTGQTVCIDDTSKGNPTKCCKIGDSGNIDYGDCGGVVITKTGYWCVKGNDYVGVYCEPSPDGKTEVCTDQTSPDTTHYTPECEHYITSPSGARICADLEPGLPQGFYCCDKIQSGQIDESSCSAAGIRSDGQSGTTTLTCNSGTLLACAPESGLVTWCTPL